MQWRPASCPLRRSSQRVPGAAMCRRQRPSRAMSHVVYTCYLLVARLAPAAPSFTCPNQCSGHGACDNTYGICACYTGFTGYDCAQRLCATGTPWVGAANGTDSARHAAVECSNGGTCNRNTGVCACDRLFQGAACDELKCPAPEGLECSGRGTCTSMADFATAADGVTSFVDADYTLWDADMIHGCVCDPPYFGHDCSLAACASGPDPGSTLTDVECNGRGNCDYTTGLCECEDGYSSSATQSDCSVKDAGTVAACPVSPSTHRRSHGGLDLTGTCSGRGLCDLGDVAKSTQCQCYDGWTGYVCDQRTCPTGRAWFDEASGLDTAHAAAECSAMGTCDREQGACRCRLGFEGLACERMRCPEDDAGRVCGGAGTCLTMRQLAAQTIDEFGKSAPATYGSMPGASNADAWDADKVQGCSCFGSVYEHRYSGANGPTAAWTGHKCSERTCPTGDPLYSVVLKASTPEVQQVSCESDADSSATTFTLTFRDHTTASIPGNAGAEEVEAALEALWTIGSVTVDMVGTATEVCAVNGSAFQVTFTSEFGPLPTLGASCLGDCTAATAAVATTGTKLNLPCAGSGECDAATGQCKCFPGFASSDGFAGSGLRLDCGYNLE